MRYKRQDTFRYQFEEPVNCNFRILKIEDREVTSKIGEAKIYDISEGGLKLTTPISIPLENKTIEIEIMLQLNEIELILTGILVWKRDYLHTHHSYGVDFIINEESKKQLIEELKIYAKGIAVIKKNTGN